LFEDTVERFARIQIHEIENSEITNPALAANSFKFWDDRLCDELRKGPFVENVGSDENLAEIILILDDFDHTASKFPTLDLSLFTKLK
jgi:hypothetical protein